MTILKFIIKILIIILCVGFVISNLQDTTFHYSPFSTPLTMPLWLLGLCIFIIGFISGSLLVWMNNLPKHFELRRTKKERDELEIERDQLTEDFHNQQSEDQTILIEDK
jgi:uncharacterized integral membrane protein